MKVDLKSGQAVLRPAKDKSFDPAQIPKAVKDAGFSPGEITLTASGTLERAEGMLRLKMAGPMPYLVLAGGAKEKDLQTRSRLLGKRVRVVGKLHPPHGDRPPGITVESFEELLQETAGKS